MSAFGSWGIPILGRGAGQAIICIVRKESKIEAEMLEVTRFFGIVIRMYFRDHSPAHFHAEYGEFEALIEIETLCILRELSRGELWLWYSNGRRFIARSSVRTGRGRVAGRLWNRLPR